jgi:DNA (cytosine-5)-methyltransferase 1
MTNFNFIDLFAGIGGMRIPYETLGGTCVFSSEGFTNR